MTAWQGEVPALWAHLPSGSFSPLHPAVLLLRLMASLPTGSLASHPQWVAPLLSATKICLPPTPVSAKSTTRYQQCPLATPATPPPSALPSCHGPRPTPRQAACRRSPLVWRSYRPQPSHPGRCASSCRRRLGVLPPLWPVGSFRHREPPSRPCSEPVHTHGREGQGHTAGTPARIPSSNPSCSPASVSLTEREAAGFTDALG